MDAVPNIFALRAHMSIVTHTINILDEDQKLSQVIRNMMMIAQMMSMKTKILGRSKINVKTATSDGMRMKVLDRSKINAKTAPSDGMKMKIRDRSRINAKTAPSDGMKLETQEQNKTNERIEQRIIVTGKQIGRAHV